MMYSVACLSAVCSYYLSCFCIIDCEISTSSIATNPASTEVGELELTRGTFPLVTRPELAAAVVLLRVGGVS